MTNEDKQSRIDDYLLGRTTGDAWRAFAEEVARNAGLSEQLADTQLAMDAVELAEDTALKARLRQLEARYQRTTAAPTAPESTAVIRKMPVPGTEKAGVRPLRNPSRLYGLAAAVLLLLLAGWFVLPPRGYDSPAALAMAAFEPYTNLTPGGVRGGPQDLQAAYAAYNAEDYTTAATLLQDLPPTAANRFYRGQSLLATKDFAGAAREFENVRMADFGLTQEAEYYLALARLGEAKTATARMIIGEISTQTSHPMYERAKGLLAEIDRLD